MTQVMPSGTPWRGSIRDLAPMVHTIRRLRAFGRLTLRSTTHVGLAHLYFRAGRLVHVVSNCGDAGPTLADLQRWTRAILRFERGIHTSEQNVSGEHERMFEDLLAQFPGRIDPGSGPALIAHDGSRVIEGRLVAAHPAEQLITPQEWSMLVESIRRVSLAVAHLVGPREAMNVLRDILDDFSSSFPAVSSLQIAAGGYLQVVRTAQLDRIPRAEVLEGFAALIATCQHFCSPIVGEEDARTLILRSLSNMEPVLASLGIFIS